VRKGGWFLVCAVAVSEPVQRVGFETQFSSQPEGGLAEYSKMIGETSATASMAGTITRACPLLNG